MVVFDLDVYRKADMLAFQGFDVQQGGAKISCFSDDGPSERLQCIFMREYGGDALPPLRKSYA